jgi:N-ethylmaleimide reductase
MTSPLFTRFDLSGLPLRNRVVMAPLTRSRAIGNVPNALMAEYYGQRASAGLIVTEGTSPSPNGLGYARIPGLFNDEQQEGWRRVAEAVHARGGKIFMQFMHTGRVGHPANLPAGARVLGPSAVAAPGEMWTDAHGNQPHPLPEEMTEADIETAIGEYAAAAKRAVAAGLDGVELHAANGYLIDQFLNVASNQRTDRWGGSVDNRVRFAVAVARQVTAAIGPGRVGMRISPANTFNGMASDPHQDDVYLRLASSIGGLGLAYLHIVDHSAMGAPGPGANLKLRLRDTYSGCLILSGGYDAARANADLVANRGDLVAFGRPFISNPDLVAKLQSGAALAAPDFDTFYTPGEKGYTDYPAGTAV